MAELRYLGRGGPGRREFIPGVPARDLNDAEAQRFGPVIEEHERNTGRALYGTAASPARRTTEPTDHAEGVDQAGAPVAEAVKVESRPCGRREKPDGE